MSELETIPPPVDLAAVEVEAELRHHLVRVYGLMVVGLLLTAAVTFWVSRQPEIVEYIQQHPGGFEALFILEMIIVAVVSRSVDKMTLAMTAATYFIYAVLNGFSFAVFFLWVPPLAIPFGFAIAASTFCAMALYGHTTSRDLGSLRSLLTMVVIGIALLSAVNLVAGNPMPYWATSYLAVMVFAALTSYHAQSIRDLESEFEDDDSDHCKAMYAGALVLYLDFVNIYLMLVRLIGATRTPRPR